MRDFYEDTMSQAVVVTSDGDFACLANFLNDRQALRSIVSPRAAASFLLRKIRVPIVYLNEFKNILEFNIKYEKHPDGDRTP